MNSIGSYLLTVVFLGSLAAAFVYDVTETDSVFTNTGSATDSDSNFDSFSAVRFSGREKSGYWKSLDEMHEHYTHAFVQSEGFGMSRIRTFHSPENRLLFTNGSPARVSRLQLIGLMNEEPVVYKASWTGLQRNQLSTYETRPLKSYEKAAIDRLQQGEPFVWKSPKDLPRQTASDSDNDKATGTRSETDAAGQRQNKFTDLAAFRNGSESPFHADPLVTGVNAKHTGRLIAALRATESCISCHNVKQGTLLGAFVYDMSPAAELRLSQTSNATITGMSLATQ